MLLVLNSPTHSTTLSFAFAGVGEDRGQGVGTLGYIPPECIHVGRSSGVNQDVFAMGMLMAITLMRKSLRGNTVAVHPVKKASRLILRDVRSIH